MNLFHRWLCRSNRWRRKIEPRMAWVLSGLELGPEVLEVGPGPGLTTDRLARDARSVTAVEIDPVLAESLSRRLMGTHVTVIHGDASALPFEDAKFSAAASFTMLHHVPSHELQDKILREVWRVLKPGGVFAGSDSLPSFSMRLIHIGDTMVLVDPQTFGSRLEAAGFRDVLVETAGEAFRFRALRPSQ
jgi:ubiquinone/menaquinone biosynthesis C-methylase UbiE